MRLVEGGQINPPLDNVVGSKRLRSGRVKAIALDAVLVSTFISEIGLQLLMNPLSFLFSSMRVITTCLC